MPLHIHFAHESRIKTLKCPENSSSNQTLIANLHQSYTLYRKKFYQLMQLGDYAALADHIHNYATTAKTQETSPSCKTVPHILSSKTKFYSSILEEVPTLLIHQQAATLLQQHPEAQKRIFALGAKDCAIRLGYAPDATLFIEHKRIDFCLSIHDPQLDAHIPLVGLEVKKYVDKTMFGTILETYKALRGFRPMTFYGFLVEDEARDPNVAKNSEMYAHEFILTGKKRNKQGLHAFDHRILHALHTELTHHMQRSIALIRP